MDPNIRPLTPEERQIEADQRQRSDDEQEARFQTELESDDDDWFEDYADEEDEDD